MSFDLIKTIKQASLEAINEHAMKLLFGIVTSVDPIKIKISEYCILTEEFLILDAPVQLNEKVIVIKDSMSNRYFVLSTIEKVYKSSVNLGGVDINETLNDGTWITCKASAYGGRDIGNLMANGERLTESCMTVAVPMGAVYKKYRNKRMLINYNGKTLTVKVTDCGNFGRGNKYPNRDLDLAPAVWKAFGAKSTSDWGLRTVKYKYID